MKRDRKYLEWIRSLPCAVLTHRLPGATRCYGAVEAHHPTGSGLALKSADREAFPLCRGHHGEFHRLIGTFKGWVKAVLKEWQGGMSDRYQALHAERSKGAA